MKKDDKLRTILKFDTGADGFQKMITILALSAILLLIIGGVFLYTIKQDLLGMS